MDALLLDLLPLSSRRELVTFLNRQTGIDLSRHIHASSAVHSADSSLLSRANGARPAHAVQSHQIRRTGSKTVKKPEQLGTNPSRALTIEPASAECFSVAGLAQVRIGELLLTVTKPHSPALVPRTLFYDIPAHVYLLQKMALDLTAGAGEQLLTGRQENEMQKIGALPGPPSLGGTTWMRGRTRAQHILLMGNQGVGKNKLVDKLLMLLHREREYIQLHRDTTVGSLTQSPLMKGGLLVWEDSPLVKVCGR